MAYLYCIVAKTGHGKSTLACQIADKVTNETGGSIILFDPHSTFPTKKIEDKLSNVPFEYKDGTFMPTDYFIKFPPNEGDVIIFDDSRIFFSPDKRKSITSLEKRLIRKRHDNYNYIFVYHSLNQISGNVIPFIDFLYLGISNDTDAELKTFGRMFGVDSNEFVNQRVKEPYQFKILTNS